MPRRQSLNYVLRTGSVSKRSGVGRLAVHDRRGRRHACASSSVPDRSVRSGMKPPGTLAGQARQLWRPPRWPRRHVADAIFYLLRSGLPVAAAATRLPAIDAPHRSPKGCRQRRQRPHPAGLRACGGSSRSDGCTDALEHRRPWQPVAPRAGMGRCRPCRRIRIATPGRTRMASRHAAPPGPPALALRVQGKAKRTPFVSCREASAACWPRYPGGRSDHRPADR